MGGLWSGALLAGVGVETRWIAQVSAPFRGFLQCTGGLPGPTTHPLCSGETEAPMRLKSDSGLNVVPPWAQIYTPGAYVPGETEPLPQTPTHTVRQINLLPFRGERLLWVTQSVPGAFCCSPPSSHPQPPPDTLCSPGGWMAWVSGAHAALLPCLPL